MIESINPATGAVSALIPLHSAAAVDATLSDAVAAQRAWAHQSVEHRCALLHRLAGVLRKNLSAYARRITAEMGKPLAEAESEIEKSAVTCEFYANHAAQFLADQPVSSNATRSAVVFDPLGVVLAIMPWNYPFWQFIRFAAPALAAGNGAILKHANNVPECALALEAAFLEAGAPRGLVGTVLIDAADVATIIADPRIAALTLTGSTAVGKLVAAQAGSVLKKQVLELGGSDPFIVLKDADVDAAARTAVKARFSNTGQSCISAKRFIVDQTIADTFSAAFCEHASRLKVGDPMASGTDIGPLARANLRDALHDQVQRSLAAGATLLLGGHALQPEGCEHGFFYAPTILDHVTPDMAAAMEETFGPAAAILRVADEAEAIRLANATEFGLGAALWTRDVERGARLARQIDAGAVFINGMVASDARLPFGGIKQSGYGRELGDYGIREFTNIKSVWVGPAR